ncbi:MAG TPA: acid phosphatase, partial [Terriglobales bacterium]|nr:acid phosphatase [Terriglobales bacterium]
VLLTVLACSFAVNGAWAEDHARDNFQHNLHKIKHIVVVYQENWSFDSLYGLFPGANGLHNSSQTSLTQVDRLNGQPLSSEASFNRAYTSGPPTLSIPPEALNSSNQIDNRFPAGLNTLRPFNLGSFLLPSDKTGDIVHRYWQEQSQINGGGQNMFVSWSDNPGLVMSYFDATNLPEGKLAQQYTMADNLFHSAFGGSFLNHQFLIAAQAPVYPNAPASLQATLDSVGQLALDPTTGKIVHDGNVTPIGKPFFSVKETFDKNYAVNTIFSANLTPTGTSPTSTSLLPSLNDSNPADATRPFTQNIGDRLDAKGVSWKWYSGGWDNALLSSPSNPANGSNPPGNAPVDPLFQWHHQPFAYFDNFAPWLPNGQRNPLSAAHLQDENNFFLDLQNESLPAVSFIKPLGPDNEHPGYASLLQGQQHVADIVKAVQNSEYWKHTLIIVTYDEHGGRWDHVAPPVVDGWGVGERVPGILIGPLVKRHFIDHTRYETDSILTLIEQRFDVKPLGIHDAKANPFINALALGESDTRREDDDRD